MCTLIRPKTVCMELRNRYNTHQCSHTVMKHEWVDMPQKFIQSTARCWTPDSQMYHCWLKGFWIFFNLESSRMELISDLGLAITIKTFMVLFIIC